MKYNLRPQTRRILDILLILVLILVLVIVILALIGPGGSTSNNPNLLKTLPAGTLTAIAQTPVP